MLLAAVMSACWSVCAIQAYVLPVSPCPGIFSYQYYGDKFWAGTLFVQALEDVTNLVITLDNPAHLQSDDPFELTTRDNISFTLSIPSSGPRPDAVNLLAKYSGQQKSSKLNNLQSSGITICSAQTGNMKLDTRNRRDNTKWVTPDFNFYGSRGSTTKPRPSKVEKWLTPDFGRLPTSTTRKQPSKKTTGAPMVTPIVPSVKPYIDKDVPQSCGVPARRPALPLITNGQDTLRGQWPWHAALYRSGGTNPTPSYICGATLVSRRSLITAAHCVTGFRTEKQADPDSLVVYLGKYQLDLRSEIGVQIKQVSKVVVHPSYNASSYYADIAVLILSSRVEYSYYVLPVCLWDATLTDLSNVVHSIGSIVGWGINETGQPTADLQLATVPVVSQDTCRQSSDFFLHFTSELSYCAGYRNGTSPCNGDSGGGMVFSAPLPDGSTRWSIRGVVSISQRVKNRNICDTNHFIVFTDVAKCISFVTGAIVD